LIFVTSGCDELEVDDPVLDNNAVVELLVCRLIAIIVVFGFGFGFGLNRLLLLLR